uniref:FAR1 domain-containing protein n=1 Tax=Chenopodium quinoa TaxID=63459 RepID=A0A803N8H0_CHEQI
MIFDSWQEIDVYFNAYEKQQGFGVVRGQSAYKHFKDGSKIKREVTWKCDYAGKPDTRRKVGGKRISRELEGEPVATKKCGCGAMVYSSFTSNGKWELRKVCLSHSHLFSPSKSMLVTKYRLEELKKVPYLGVHSTLVMMLGFLTQNSIGGWLVSGMDMKMNTRLCDFAEKQSAAMEQRFLLERLADVAYMRYLQPISNI